MKEKTQTTPEGTNEAAVAHMQVAHDLRNSVLIVSVVANLIVLTAWIALQVTTRYDMQIAALLFNR